LTRFLLEKGCHVVSISRSKNIEGVSHENFRYLSADTTLPGDWQEELQDADVVINLAGVNIFNYWTKKYKQAIYDSRIRTTRNLVNALPEGNNITFISASALGFYGDRGDDILNEKEPAGTDFLAKVCEDWENEAFQAETKGSRVLIARFGVVADKSGGAMKMMLPPFRFFVGGPLGKGTQFFPWIHLTDLVYATWHLVEHRELKGIFNFCAPMPIRNRDMSKTIGKLLHRPSFLAVPKFAIRLLIGELGSMVLFSQRGNPENLLESGFKFKFPDFGEALQEIIS
jgi:uncharacterized protein (TIGR01777 family)